jgi:hypothetical protein
VLDIRAVAYVSPVSEVPFQSVALTVRISNVADETGLVTGKFRVYNSITGMLIHTSAIIPFSLAAGATVDVSALTTFDPPAPATSCYFVNFDGTAKNDLVPDECTFALGSFYFDVLPTGMGPAPAAHHATHELGGSDEIDCTGLPGTGGAGGNIEDLPTAEMNPSLVLAPDGAGGVEFRTESGGGGGGPSDTPQTLTDGATIDWDLSAGGFAVITLGGDRTINNPTNPVDGSRATLRIIQDATGTRLLSWDTDYHFPGGIPPTLSASANAIDIILFCCDGSSLLCVGAVFDV